MIVIKRYSNRKLYDSEARQYITLEEIGDMVQRGEEIQVIDHVTGADLTTHTLSQILVEQEKKIGGSLPQVMLTKLIRSGSNRIQSLHSSIAAFVEPMQFIEDEICRRLDILTEEGELGDEEKQKLEVLLLSARFRQREQDRLAEMESDVASSEDIEQLIAQLNMLEQELKDLQKSDSVTD